MDIQKVIKEKGFTQNEVAERLGITKSSLSQSVHNENTSIKMMRKIADVIGCKVGDFFKDEMEEATAQTPSLVCPHCGKEIKVTLE